jgi:hypothetical protein
MMRTKRRTSLVFSAVAWLALLGCSGGGGGGATGLACSFSDDQIEEMVGMTVDESESRDTDYGGQCIYRQVGQDQFGTETVPAVVDIRVYDDTERGQDEYEHIASIGRKLEQPAGGVHDIDRRAIVKDGDRYVSVRVERDDVAESDFLVAAELLDELMAD